MNGNYPNNQQSGFGMDYTVDMVFCIDATGSMENFTGSQKCIINMVNRFTCQIGEAVFSFLRKQRTDICGRKFFWRRF